MTLYCPILQLYVFQASLLIDLLRNRCMVDSAVLNCSNYDKMYTYADEQLIYLPYTLNMQNTSCYLLLTFIIETDEMNYNLK